MNASQTLGILLAFSLADPCRTGGDLAATDVDVLVPSHARRFLGSVGE